MPRFDKFKNGEEKLRDTYSVLSASAVFIFVLFITTFIIAISCNSIRERNSSFSATNTPTPPEAIFFNATNYTNSQNAIKDAVKIDRKDEKETKNNKRDVKPVKKVVNKPESKIVILNPSILLRVDSVKNLGANFHKKSQDYSLPKANSNNCASQAKIYKPKVIWIKKNNNLTQIGNTTPPPLGSITIKVPSKVPSSLNDSQGIVKVKCPTASGGYAYSNNANSSYFLN